MRKYRLRIKIANGEWVDLGVHDLIISPDARLPFDFQWATVDETTEGFLPSWKDIDAYNKKDVDAC